MGRQDAALVMDQGHVVVGDLALAFLPAKLADRLNDTEQTTSSTRMGVGQHTAMSVDGKPTIQAYISSLNHVTRTPAIAKTKLFHFDHYE